MGSLTFQVEFLPQCGNVIIPLDTSISQGELPNSGQYKNPPVPLCFNISATTSSFPAHTQTMMEINVRLHAFFRNLLTNKPNK